MDSPDKKTFAMHNERADIVLYPENNAKRRAVGIFHMLTVVDCGLTETA
jgi:hypothetical protein